MVLTSNENLTTPLFLFPIPISRDQQSNEILLSLTLFTSMSLTCIPPNKQICLEN